MKKYGNISFALVTLAFPVSLFVGKILEWSFKARNPDGVDITAGLAYLRPLLLSSFSVFAVIAAAAVAYALLGIKRDSDSSTAKNALIILVVSVILFGGAAFADRKISQTEDRYREDHLNSFFKTLNN